MGGGSVRKTNFNQFSFRSRILGLLKNTALSEGFPDFCGTRVRDMDENSWLCREEALIGKDNVEKLKKASVLVFGIGGVGSYAVEALARAGIGKLTLVDGDTVSVSNINRQLIADTETVGRAKAVVAAERVRKINPSCTVVAVTEFCDETNTVRVIEDAAPDFIVDAIDCVSTKLIIAEYAVSHGMKMISSMGTGNKLYPEKLRIADISKTEVCPLARVMRKKLRERNILHLPVVFSTEIPVSTGERVPASVSFVPSAAGILIAGYAVRTLIGRQEQ